MGDFNVAEAEVIMLEIVDPDINKVFEEEANLWNLLGQGEAQFTNARGVRLVTHVEPNPAMGWYPEGGNLAVGGTSHKIDMRVFYLRFNISGTLTGDAIDTTSEESLLEGLSSRIKEDTMTGMKEFSQQLYQDGKGTKATVSTDTSLGGGAITTGAGGNFYLAAPYGARQLLRTGLYNAYSSAGTARVNGGGSVYDFTLTTVNNGTQNVVADTVPSDLADTDVVVSKGSYNRSIHGLPYHVNDDGGLYQGQSRTTYPKLKAVVIDANGADLTVSLLDKLLGRAKYRTGAKVTQNDFMIVSSPTQEHAYKSLGYNLKRFQGPSGKFDGGYDTIEHNGIPWVVDIDCSDSDLYMLRTKSFGKYQVRPFGLLRESGQVLHQIPAALGSTSGTGTFQDRYQYFINAKMDLGCTTPHVNCRLKNLSRTNLAGGIFSY